MHQPIVELFFIQINVFLKDLFGGNVYRA